MSEEARTLYMSDVPEFITQQHVKDVFGKIGDVSVSRVVDVELGQAGFKITFTSLEAARHAFFALDGLEYLGVPLLLTSSVFKREVDADRPGDQTAGVTRQIPLCASLPHNHLLPPDLRIDEILFPSVTDLRESVADAVDTSDAINIVRNEYPDADEVVARFVALQARVAEAEQQLKATLKLQAEQDEELQVLKGIHSDKFSPTESVREAEALKEFRISNSLPIPALLISPSRLVTLLSRVVGPVTACEITFVQQQSFKVVVEFLSPHSAKYALRLLNTTSNTAQASVVFEDLSEELLRYRKFGWQTVSVPLPRVRPPQWWSTRKHATTVLEDLRAALAS